MSGVETSRRHRRDFVDMSDAELIALEESLYDDEVDGEDCWHQRDRVLNEMNFRDLMDRKKTP